MASGWQGPFTLGSKQYYGALREDTVAKKVYAWAPALQSDVLLHDFGLAKSDRGDGFMDGLSGKNLSVSVFNAVGQRVDTVFSRGSIDLSPLPKGVYFIRVDQDIPGWTTVVKL